MSEMFAVPVLEAGHETQRPKGGFLLRAVRGTYPASPLVLVVSRKSLGFLGL